jgi:hypothetical protein
MWAALPVIPRAETRQPGRLPNLLSARPTRYLHGPVRRFYLLTHLQHPKVQECLDRGSPYWFFCYRQEPSRVPRSSECLRNVQADFGERYYCRDCGAAGDADDTIPALVMLPQPIRKPMMSAGGPADWPEVA